MSRGVAIFLLGFAVLLPVLGQAQEDGQTANQPAEQAEAEIEPPAFPVRITETEAEREARKRIQNEAAERERADLVAQEGMNTATQRMADDASLQTWFVGFGTLLVFGTLLLMIQANRAAIQAASAAQDSVTLMEEMSKRQLRAYVCVSNVRIENFKVFEIPTITFEVRNHGPTPAMDVEVIWRAERVYGDPHRCKLSFNGMTWGSKFPLGAGHYVRPSNPVENVLSMEFQDSFIVGEGTYLVFGYIRYKDIFGVQRRTIFRNFLSAQYLKGSEGRLPSSSKHNHAT